MLAIRHVTHYRYTEPIGYTIQTLRLSPRPEAHQHVLSWNISTPGRRTPFVDAYGNLSQILTVTEPHQEIRIQVEGLVDLLPLDRGRLAGCKELSPLVFTVPTRLTEPTPEVSAFAQASLPEQPRSADFIALAEAIAGTVAYRSGATGVHSTAAEALALGQGVCQDHAHLFLACCHARGIPARYVSGYIHAGLAVCAESHAWVDVWVEEKDFSGWISLDVTHACLQGDALCRLAVGRDYDSASPVRGMRRGGGDESLFVQVQVEAVPAEQ